MWASDTAISQLVVSLPPHTTQHTQNQHGIRGMRQQLTLVVSSYRGKPQRCWFKEGGRAGSPVHMGWVWI